LTRAETLRLLAFVHPIWMVTSVALAVATARLGLEIRKRRASGRTIGPELRRRHLRLGKTAIGLVLGGFVLGALSMSWLRERAVFESFHSVLGIVVCGLFAWTGLSGRALARGDQTTRALHRGLAAASLAAALLSAVAGFVLLP